MSTFEPSSKRTGSLHLSSPPASDVFDPNKRGELDSGLRNELDYGCFTTEGRLDSFAGYERARPKDEDTALLRLLAHLEDISHSSQYEKTIVARLNGYIDGIIPSRDYRFVYLDRPFNQLKIRPDIVIVHKSCLAKDVQEKRRQPESEAGTSTSGLAAGTGKPCLLSGQSWHACTDRYVSAITSNVCLPRQANRGLGKCLERELSRLRDSEITGKCQPPNSLNLREKGTDSA